MVFLWSSYGFPMVFLWFSYGFPMVFPWYKYQRVSEDFFATSNPVAIFFRGEALVQPAGTSYEGLP